MFDLFSFDVADNGLRANFEEASASTRAGSAI